MLRAGDPFVENGETSYVSTYRILLIEDNPFFQGIWNSIIGRATNASYSLDWANTDFIASEMLEKNEYDLIISDIILPGKKTGIDIWKEHDCKNSLYIFVSSIPEEAFHEFMKQNDKQADHFIQKPLNLNYCIEFMATVIRDGLRSKVA